MGRGIVTLKSPDLIIITSEGATVKTHAVLLGTFSSWLGEILRTSVPECWNETICISVPFNKDECEEFVKHVESNKGDNDKHCSDDIIGLFNIDQETNHVDEEIVSN